MLWIDLWDKKCWIAIEIEWVIIPKDIIARVELVDYLRKIILEYKIKTIVVGLPYDLYWKDLRQLNKTQQFIEKLKNIFPDILIEWVDERFTSFEADNILNGFWSKNNWLKDHISASLILETYIKQKSK